ncbi:hypothetical protein ABEB36_000224 [Hypothenemus hampei]|uniref:MADF domain-containing protein n=1 Tax=Hypothenemus hampei TaxID=57062 RepID=A0ABD1FBB5_HYPHA
MSDLRQCSHEFLSEFIKLYRSFPCLWQIKSKQYSDRDKKRQAYDILIQKYKEVDHAAKKETIIKKINSLRTVYRKELSKVNNSIRSGAGDEDIYKPTLWYFDLLSFLNDQEIPRKSTSTIDDETDASDIDIFEIPTTPISSVSGHVLESSSSSSKGSTRKRKPTPDDDKTIEVLTLVGKRIESLNSQNQANDPFDVFGTHVANKLRSINKAQNMFAQKLINDVLFDAEMEALNRNFKVIDVGVYGSHCNSTRVSYERSSNIPLNRYTYHQSEYEQESQTYTSLGLQQQDSSNQIKQKLHPPSQQSQQLPIINQKRQNTTNKRPQSDDSDLSAMQYSNFLEI